MRNSRTLSLKREALSALSTDDLAAIAGAAEAATQGGICELGESFLACSARCQWTFNTCECW